MTWKSLRTIIQQLLLMCKNEYISCFHIKTTKSWKPNYYFDDSKQRTIVLSCSKKPSKLLRGITSKHLCGFYCLDCLHSFRTKDRLKSHKKVCEN